MDKLNFQKAIDTLKNTECTTKEKIGKFDQIQSCLSQLHNHSNFKSFLSSAVQILLLFCEDNDSNCRISAEENLNKIIRSAERSQQIFLVQIDLYHELKKNGNERTLRICLNLFAHFSHLIKHRRRKVYSQNLLPCLMTIGKRKEPLVIESLAEFMKAFARNLQDCLTDGETQKLVDVFLDNLASECAIKKRCSAQNIVSMMEKLPKLIKTVILRIQENLCKNHGVLGTLGLVRLLVPLLMEPKWHQNLLELLESCLMFLKTETNHSIVNANLEVLQAMLMSASDSKNFQDLLADDQKMLHKDMLLSRRSMSAFISSRKSSDTETLKTSYLQVPSTSTSVMSTPNKSLTDFSDVEGDSFKSVDFESEISSSPATMRNLIERGAETMSLKSTDSINSFFNSIASNTETVSKFFRKSSTDSPVKTNEIVDEKSFDLSLGNMQEIVDSQSLPETAEMAMEDEVVKVVQTHDEFIEILEQKRELFIGTLFDQSIAEYIVRLVASKFLLEGTPRSLISDTVIRVSIKNLALSVIAGCVNLKPAVLMMKLQKDFTDESMMVESLLSYLVDEDLRLAEEEKKPEAAGTSESFLKIKDDHFGECTTATFLDYFSPLSQSLDEQRLISMKNQMYEEKMSCKDREESVKKINKDLCQLLSRSEIVEAKLPLMETTLKMPEDKDCQFVADVLMFSTHSDPVLRGNVYQIVGSFLRSVLKRNFDFNEFVSQNEIVEKTLEFTKLIGLLMNGLKDEIHTVVRQTLIAVDGLVDLLVVAMDVNEVRELLEQLSLVFSNKYWLVQCKYCDVMTKVNLKLIKEKLGTEEEETFQTLIINQLFDLIKDNDFRVRNHISELLPSFILKLASESQNFLYHPYPAPLRSLVDTHLFNFESFFLDLQDNNSTDSDIELQLSKTLYNLSNFLMDTTDKNQQFGVIYALKILIRRFSPLSYPKPWKEFNILSVLLSFMNKNPGIALDISCQSDMLEVIATLTGAGLGDSVEFMLHLMRILNIYAHLVSNTKLLLMPKQKNKDIFTSAKELAAINSLGFFSSDHFYLKLYLVLKSSFESFKMTINRDAEIKLKQLLHVTLKSLQTLLELKTMKPDHVKIVEETVGYLQQLMAFQPEDCVVTTKILLKFLFQRNYVNRKGDFEAIRSQSSTPSEAFFESFENFLSFEFSCPSESSIKHFDPLVIQGLRMFSKSPAKLQATILDMLCQLLEFNVNYMQLDAKKVFVDFVMRQLEYIEGSLVIDGHLLAPKIVQFLIYLTKLKDKKIITIPKIINIVDNLLAVSRESGIAALQVLSVELFFRKNNMKGDPDVIEELCKERNAQREVVISMLLKFLSHGSIQEYLSWILIKSRVNPSIAKIIDESEIYQQLIQCIKEEAERDHRLICNLSKNILLESKNFEAVLEIYLDMIRNKDINPISTIIMIQEQVISKAEEVYLTNHVKLYHQKKEDEGSDPVTKFLELHQDFLLKNLDSLKLWKFLTFRKLPTFRENLKMTFNFKKIMEASSSDVSNFQNAMHFALALNLDKAMMFDLISAQNQQNQKILRGIFYRSLFAKRNDINAWENSELMDFFKDNDQLQVLLQFGQNILLDSLLEDPKISRIILKKLPAVEIPHDRFKYLLENVHEECLADAVNLVVEESLRCNPKSRIFQLILVKKFHLVKNEILMGKDKHFLQDFSPSVSELKNFPSFAKAVEELASFIKSRSTRRNSEIDASELSAVIDESWLLSHAKQFVLSNSNLANPTQIAQMLLEIKSESKLVTLLTIEDFNLKLLPAMLDVSFERMIRQFRVDCVQINPHLNYMKISALLKISLLILMKNLESGHVALAETLSIFLKWVKQLYEVSLINVEVKFIDRFVSDNLLKPPFIESILDYLKVLIGQELASDVVIEAVCDIYSEHRLWTEIPQETSEHLVKLMYVYLTENLTPSDFVSRYQQPPLFDDHPANLHFDICSSGQADIPRYVVFLAKIQEAFEDGDFNKLQVSSSVRSSVEKLLEISRHLLRKFYQFAVTPYEILLSYRSGDGLLDSNYNLKQIPIEYLSDSELLERYIRRINRYGFTQRQQFEEIFMTLLVLLNQWNEIQDADEQFYIKQLCLQTNVELIVSCFRHPVIGCNENSFFHYPRCEKIKLESVGLKKLHHIQELLDSELSVFYQPNLEIIGTSNNLISSKNFGMSQFALNYSWQMIESREEVASAGSILTRNVNYYQEKCGIDFKSALQMIYDVMTQMIDENPVLVLQQLVKLVDILDDVEQFRWINKKMLELYESIASEDTVSHQFVAYLLCKSAAALVPSLSELHQLQLIINKYLGCNQIFVRNAALQGLLCLFESICKTNTTIGAMSDEMKILRNCITNYTSKNGIVYESNIKSLAHDKLVWALNFYVIEMTSKFVTDGDVFIDSIISANNILKRTSDLDLFYLILNGLERLVITNPANRSFREKIEKLALDLMKVENKLYSIGGLKLLVTCLYSGSLEQLENTEKSNGIVQDEPEILMQSTEKIEMLFTRIRTATIEEAEIYGRVLGQILKDLLPPNEILSKVVKELLIMNQSNCTCVAIIIHQVFRSAIDSSYLVLLQDWLICSLQNFLTYPHSRKSIWFLSLIFLSSTLNQNLLKLFPILLDENLESSELHQIFLVSAKDFYEKLSEQQRGPFKEAFMSRIKTKMMSSSNYSNASPTNSFAFNNNLFQTFIKHL